MCPCRRRISVCTRRSVSESHCAIEQCATPYATVRFVRAVQRTLFKSRVFGNIADNKIKVCSACRPFAVDGSQQLAANGQLAAQARQAHMAADITRTCKNRMVLPWARARRSYSMWFMYILVLPLGQQYRCCYNNTTH